MAASAIIFSNWKIDVCGFDTWWRFSSKIVPWLSFPDKMSHMFYSCHPVCMQSSADWILVSGINLQIQLSKRECFTKRRPLALKRAWIIGSASKDSDGEPRPIQHRHQDVWCSWPPQVSPACTKGFSSLSVTPYCRGGTAPAVSKNTITQLFSGVVQSVNSSVVMLSHNITWDVSLTLPEDITHVKPHHRG